jgi:phosphoglycerate dehydrogenase-like enzyme
MLILIHPPVDAARLSKIHEAASPAEVMNASTIDEALAAMPRATGFFGKITPELLSVARELRWVQSPTASLEHYLFPALIEHPCTLTNMRGLFSDVIADHVFGYILAFARNFPIYWRQQQERRWAPVGGESERTSFSTGPGTVSAMDRAHLHLSDTTLGIGGLGHIGREIARRGQAFGMCIVYIDPMSGHDVPGVERLGSVEHLPELLHRSDFVVIAAPHTPETEGMFGSREFHAMKRSAYLINIGRGAIVQLDALVSALQTELIAGAGLDVFEVEPLPHDHPLWEFKNVILTPHVAAASPRIAERHLEVLLDNIGRFVRGEPLRNVADKRLWF